MWDFVRHSDIGLPFLIDYLNTWERNVRELERARVIRYEDLRARPAETLLEIVSLIDPSFTEEEIERGDAYYNYKHKGFPSTEAPGASVFYKDEDGTVYHTYSVYERGLDMFLTAYHYLDLVPKGRDEDGFSFPMEWLRLRDSYKG